MIAHSTQHAVNKHSTHLEVEFEQDNHSIDSDEAHAIIHKVKDRNGTITSNNFPPKLATKMILGGIPIPETIDVDISFKKAFILLGFYDLWILLNALLIYLLKISSCSTSYLLAVFFISESSFGIGFGACKIKGSWEIFYVIIVSLLTGIFVMVIILEFAVHFVVMSIKHGDKSVDMIHYGLVGLTIFLFLIISIIQMAISDYDFGESAFQVFSTWWTTGYYDPPKTTAGLLLCIFSMHFCLPLFAYVMGFIGGTVWDKFIKSQNEDDLEHELEAAHAEEFLENLEDVGDKNASAAFAKVEKYMGKIHKMENTHLKDGAMERIVLQKLQDHNDRLADAEQQSENNGPPLYEHNDPDQQV